VTLADRLARLKHLAANATQGPWWTHKDSDRHTLEHDQGCFVEAPGLYTLAAWLDPSNSDFIAAAHPGVVVALAEVAEAADNRAEHRENAYSYGSDRCPCRVCAALAALEAELGREG
jgi:hypothetical protein